MSDFECHPRGTAARIAALESQCESLGDECKGLEAERNRLRDKNTELNRRCTRLDGALVAYEKARQIPPDGDGLRFVKGSFARILMAELLEKQDRTIAGLKRQLVEAQGCLSELLDAMHRYEMDVDCGPTSEHRLMMVRARRALSHRQHEPAEDAFRAGWIAAMQVCGETDIDPDTDAAYRAAGRQQEVDHAGG